MIRAAVLLLALIAAPVAAQVISPAPDKVAVTIYRDPQRSVEDEMDLDYLRSFALIAETRTVELPPGVVTIRFEGVAGGIIPQSAILFGSDIREKNRDALLLSQKGLIDAFTGQRVRLRRTGPDGKTVIEDATIRSGSNGMVLQTPRGMEAVYCTGHWQTVLYPDVPKTLSAKPVLSMVTRDQPGGKVTITLAYLASNFDWNATYIGTLSPDAKSLSLFAWLTMASGDETTFPDATAAAVAGRVNREAGTRDDQAQNVRWEAMAFQPRANCWPQGTTSAPYSPPQPPLPPPAMEMDYMGESGDIVVTGSRIMQKNLEAASPISVITASSENLGDLKLYRVPVPVTVAAQSQKQVAFLQKPRIKGRVLYRSRSYNGDGLDDPEMLFRFKNSKKDGAGDLLPAGQVAMFQPQVGERLLVGEGNLSDKTIDEEVDVVFGKPANLTIEHIDRDEDEPDDVEYDEHRVVVRNANPQPVHYELEFTNGDYRLTRPSKKLVKRPGKQVWIVTVPANGEAALDYRTSDIEDEPEHEEE